MVYQLTKFDVQRVDMVINSPWNLPFLGAKGLTSPKQMATGVNTPGSDENSLKLYDLIADVKGGRATWEFCQYSAATEISDLEQKTFTRSKIERLTALFHSRSNESSSADVVERDGANRYSSPSSLLRLEASTSGSLKKHGNERDNLHAAISTPMVTSRDFVVMTIPDLDLADLYH
ncbi:hypothetical protein Tco_0957310 [Tanacetum coccineum]